MVTPPEVKYLLFDIESVADGAAIAKTKYAGLNLQPNEAVFRFRQELLAETGKDFIPHTYHIPVAVVIAKLRADLSIVDIVSLDQPLHRPPFIAKQFWSGWEFYKQPTFVTFNGRSFDLPVMELAAYRYGIAVPAWFNMIERTYQQSRNRYNLQSHIDLHEILTNYGSTWFRGGLNLAANLVAKPGKMNVQGDMVQDFYESGRVAEISDYCRCDVLDTYFVFLRLSVLMGSISLDKERSLVEEARKMLESKQLDHPSYRAYLQAWQDWESPFEG